MNRKIVSVIALLVLLLAALACGGTDTGEEPGGSREETEEPSSGEDRPTPARETAGVIRQWATSAIASSEYGNPSWSAMQATGAPDTPECGDQVTAWASESSDTVEWIELAYDEAVRPTEVNIFQTYNPDQVVVVELIDTDSAYYEIYAREPELTDECPYVISIPMVDFDYAVDGIRITIDQSALEIGWNEIDAVELVGIPAD